MHLRFEWGSGPPPRHTSKLPAVTMTLAYALNSALCEVGEEAGEAAKLSNSKIVAWDEFARPTCRPSLGGASMHQHHARRLGWRP